MRVEFKGERHDKSFRSNGSMDGDEAVLMVGAYGAGHVTIHTTDAESMRNLGRNALALAVRLEKHQQLAALLQSQVDEAEKQAEAIEAEQFAPPPPPKPKK